MSLRPQTCPEVPASTATVARAAFPRGNPYLRLRDALGTVVSDAQFARFAGNNRIGVITHPLTRTCLRCRISSLRQYRAAVALKVIVGEIPVVRSVARPFWSPLLERYWSEAELLSNGLGSTV